MGQICCCRKLINLPSKNQFLFQLNRFIPKNQDCLETNNDANDILNTSSISGNSNLEQIENYQDPKNLKENLTSEKGIFKFLFYDINQNNTLIIEKKLEIITTLEGLSELNFDQELYLCGNSKLEDDEGSFLFELNPINPKTKTLVNSIYSHYYPSLISYESKYIFCIGGKNQIRCEFYNIEKNNWEPLPNLPEERYLCTLSLESKNKTIYLFGGINSLNPNIGNNFKVNIENDYILRIKNEKYRKWEKLEIKDENSKRLLKRISSASLIFEDQPDNIYILGGENEQKHFLNEIIRFNISSCSLFKIHKQLDFPTIFLNQYAKKYENNSYMYVFIDKFNNVIKIDKHDFLEFSSFEKLEI